MKNNSLEKYFHFEGFDDRKNYCWVTKRRQIYADDKTIHECHIKDEVFCNAYEKYDEFNTIKLCDWLHNLMDQRLIYFDEDGWLRSNALSKDYLSILGIPKQARLPIECLTQERRSYLRQRINDFKSYKFNRLLAQNARQTQAMHCKSS